MITISGEYLAKSGNLVKFTIRENANDIGIIATWKFNPSDDDLKTFMDWIGERYSNTVNDTISYTLDGKGVAGKARAHYKVENFVKTGALPDDARSHTKKNNA